MTDQPTRCPLCGWQQRMPIAYCECANCGLQISKWPRVAELVAIRDAVLAWAESNTESDAFTWKEEATLMRLARAELERQRKEANQCDPGTMDTHADPASKATSDTKAPTSQGQR